MVISTECIWFHYRIWTFLCILHSDSRCIKTHKTAAPTYHKTTEACTKMRLWRLVYNLSCAQICIFVVCARERIYCIVVVICFFSLKCFVYLSEYHEAEASASNRMKKKTNKTACNFQWPRIVDIWFGYKNTQILHLCGYPCVKATSCYFYRILFDTENVCFCLLFLLSWVANAALNVRDSFIKSINMMFTRAYLLSTARILFSKRIAISNAMHEFSLALIKWLRCLHIGCSPRKAEKQNQTHRMERSNDSETH